LAISLSYITLPWVHTQTRMDDARLTDETTLACRRMNALAKILRRRRTERGALTLASAEVKFKIDTETHDPMDVGMYQVQRRGIRRWKSGES
jgi:exosome complex exonuclease DIS3/RRP44